MQTIRDGKSIIIEGLHLDPGLYLYEFGKYGIRHLHLRSDSLLPSEAGTARQDDPVLVEPVNPEPINLDRAVQQGAELQPDAGSAASQPVCLRMQLSDLLFEYAVLSVKQYGFCCMPCTQMPLAGSIRNPNIQHVNVRCCF